MSNVNYFIQYLVFGLLEVICFKCFSKILIIKCLFNNCSKLTGAKLVYLKKIHAKCLLSLFIGSFFFCWTFSYTIKNKYKFFKFLSDYIKTFEIFKYES